MLLKMCLILFVLTRVKTSILNVTSHHTSQISERLIKVFDECYPENLKGVVIIDQNSRDGDITDSFVKHVHKKVLEPVVVLQNLYSKGLRNLYELIYTGTLSTADAVFWFLDAVDHDFWDTLEDFKGMLLWNPSAKYLITLKKSIYIPTDDLDDLFSRIWDEYKIMNVVLIYCNEIGVRNWVKTSNPFKYKDIMVHIVAHNQFMTSGKVIDLSDKCDGSNHDSLFFDKLLDVNGYEFFLPTRKTIDAPEAVNKKGQTYMLGYEGSQINTLMETLNATTDIFYPESDTFWSDIFDEDFLQSKKKQAVMFGNCNIKTLNNYRMSTYPYDDSCIRIIVPKSMRMPHYMNVILPFSETVWLFYFSTIPFLVISWKVMKLDTTLESGTTIETFRVLITGATKASSSSFSNRLFIFLCLWYSLLTMNSYQGALTSYLTTPHYYPDINTLPELYQTDMPIAVHSISGFDYINDVNMQLEMNNKLVVKFIERASFTTNIDYCLNMVAFERNLTFVSTEKLVRYFKRLKKYHVDGYPLLHIIDFCVLKGQIVFDFPEMSPFRDKFSELAGRMFEGGLPEKWYHDSMTGSKFVQDDVETREILKPLSFQHVQATFSFLMVGLGLSSLVFVCEIIMKKTLVK